MWDILLQFVKTHSTASVITVVAVLGTIFEVSKIPLNPWGWICKIMKRTLRAAGRLMTEDIQTQLDGIRSDLSDLSHEHEADRKKSLRRSILRFADECRMRQIRHSKEMFDDTLNDIDAYEAMCGGREKVDSVLAESIRIIKEANHTAFKENSYL